MSARSLIDDDKPICWNPAYRVEVLDDGVVFLCSEIGKTVMRGRAFCLLAPLLVQGTYSASALVDELSGKESAEKVYFALAELEKKTLIQSRVGLLPENVASFCGLLNVSEEKAAERLKQTPIYVEGSSGICDLLKAWHVSCVEQASKADFSLICVEDYLECRFESRKPWILCKPWGSEIWVGPLFVPGKTGCYTCLETRLKMNRIEEAYVREKQNLERFSPPFHASLDTRFAEYLIAQEVFKWIVMGENKQLEGRLKTVNTLTFEVREHFLIRRPTCPRCGEAKTLQTASFNLVSRKKESKEGGYRTLTPEETVEQYEKLVSPITGVVNCLEPLSTSNSPSIHVYCSGVNWAFPEFRKGEGMYNLRKLSGGKGTSKNSAKAGGLCEALERASGVFHGDEPRIQATYKQIQEQAIHPNAVQQFSAHQFSERKRLNALSHSCWKIDEPFPEEEEISWTPLYSLTEQRKKYMPTRLCYYLAPKDAWEGRADSNGCAAGNCLEEAILQGFFELVERDSIALWWYNRLQCPLVDLTSFRHPYIAKLMEDYEALDREIWILDITTDLAIPSFVALSRLRNSSEEWIYLGFGAHLDVEIALLRALTEMNQFVGIVDSWEKGKYGESAQDKIDQEVLLKWMKTVKVEDHPYLKFSMTRKSAADYQKWESSDLLQDIAMCRKTVEDLGMEFLVLDQTRPEIGLNVARVVVPGLRHFWPRFAPGRLYDVPVEIGRLKVPTQEEELNPFWMFL